MSIENDRIARCVGWLEGFSTTVWALLSTNDGSRLVDASAGEEYEATVRMLCEALYAPKCGIVDPMQDAPRPKVTYETVGEWHGPVTVTMKSCGDAE